MSEICTAIGNMTKKRFNKIAELTDVGNKTAENPGEIRKAIQKHLEENFYKEQQEISQKPSRPHINNKQKNAI